MIKLLAVRYISFWVYAVISLTLIILSLFSDSIDIVIQDWYFVLSPIILALLVSIYFITTSGLIYIILKKPKKISVHLVWVYITMFLSSISLFYLSKIQSYKPIRYSDYSVTDELNSDTFPIDWSAFFIVLFMISFLVLISNAIYTLSKVQREQML